MNYPNVTFELKNYREKLDDEREKRQIKNAIIYLKEGGRRKQFHSAVSHLEKVLIDYRELKVPAGLEERKKEVVKQFESALKKLKG